MSSNVTFKTCPSCSHVWKSREEFLSDPNLDLNGYKADFAELEYGMFFFTHTLPSCCSTMVLLVNDFRSLYSGTTYKDNLAESEKCPRFCIDETQLSRCDAMCECAFVREIIQIVSSRQKPDGHLL